MPVRNSCKILSWLQKVENEWDRIARLHKELTFFMSVIYVNTIYLSVLIM